MAAEIATVPYDGLVGAWHAVPLPASEKGDCRHLREFGARGNAPDNARPTKGRPQKGAVPWTVPSAYRCSPMRRFTIAVRSAGSS